MRREGAPRWAGEADLRRAAKVTRLKNTPFCTQLAHIVGLQYSHAAPAPPRRAPLPAAAPPAVPPPPLVLRERELLSSWARVSSIDPEYRSKLAALVRTGPPGAPGTRAPRDAPAAAPPRVSPPPPPPRAAVAGEEAAAAAAKRGEQESALRASELRQLARMERVASLLKSEFRADLEQLISIHSELIAHGISQARRESFDEPAGARAPPSPPPPPPPPAASEPSRGVEARLRQMEETVHAQLERFAQQSAAQAAALQHVTQLLQANFSLGLSLQEQQGRTAAALYSLAQQRPPASAELAAPPSPRGACEGEAALALARIEAMLRDHSAALRQVACLQQKVAAREKGGRRRNKRLKLRVGGPPDGEEAGERREARACEGMEREASPAGLEGGAPGREAPSVQEGVRGGMASVRGRRASVRGGMAAVRDGRTAVREDTSPVREGNLVKDPPAVRAVREDTVREGTPAVRGGRASARGRASRRGRESAREGRASTRRDTSAVREGTLSVRAATSSEDTPAVREDTPAAHEAPPAVREATPALLEGLPVHSCRVSTDGLAPSVRKAHEGSRPRRAAGQAAYEGARTGEEAQGGQRGGVEAVCGLCCERPMDAVMYRCGHQCACMQCAYFLLHNKAPCPICRAPVEDVIRVFQVR